LNLFIYLVMRPGLIAAVFILLLTAHSVTSQVTVNFAAPDTVCTGQTVNITNFSTGGTTYYWSFCSGNTLSNPVGTNIGNPGGILGIPVYITLVKDASGCYSFVTNQGGGYLVRYFHGTSFNNNPVSWTNLGSFGMISDSVEGLRIRYDNGQWIGFVNSNNRIARLNFGGSLANTPTADLLGPYGMLYMAHSLEILKEGGTWIGYTVCTWGNNLVRLNFRKQFVKYTCPDESWNRRRCIEYAGFPEYGAGQWQLVCYCC
jgi:hypothetical protein